MPALNIIENNDRIIEINHHLVHLNTHHYNDWINPRDLLNTFLYHHGTPAGSGGYLPGSPTQAGHHTFSHINDTHLGNTTPGLPPHPGHPGTDETDDESLIVVYALFLPLLAALIFILIVALYVRRMRRSSSMQNVTLQNEAYEFSLEQIKSRSTQFSSNNNNSKMKDSSFSGGGGIPPNSNHSTGSNNKGKSHKKILTRSVSSSGISHHIEATGSQREVIPYGVTEVTGVAPDVTLTITSETGLQGRNNNNKSLKNISGRLISALNVPKRIKQNSIEKKRFNIYTIPIETREQLKQIYVY
ncbi:unnamed protein product [Allacma fusca]|uniref:Uncharacterized protein n=1 Tax=Allacma fusca TaxID=39272 RepID=A0A8J2LBC7_9HEXA|nr:unnamed protein product [Allacma fusca]